MITALMEKENWCLAETREGTCCFFSGIYPRSLPIRLAFDECVQCIMT